MIIPEIIYSTVANKCARCHKGKIFEKNNPYSFKGPFEMREFCSECDLKYEREPGFFYGALYVSYALMSGIFIIWFFTDLLWIHMEAVNLAILVVSSMLVLFPVVLRSARIIWLNFFIRYNKKYTEKNKVMLHSKLIDSKGLNN